MKQICKLIKIELSNIYFLKQGKSLFLKDIITLVVFALFTTMNGAIYLKNMTDSIMRQEAPAIFFVVIQIAVLYEVILYLKDVMFSKNSYTLLCSMPIPKYKIVISKMLCLIFSALRLELFLGLPFLIVCVIILDIPITWLISYLILYISMAILICTATVSLYSKRYLISLFTLGISAIYIIWLLSSNMSISETVISYLVSAILFLVIIAVMCCICVFLVQQRYLEILTNVNRTFKNVHHTTRKNNVIAAICNKESICFWNTYIWIINSLAFICMITIAFAVMCLFTDNVELFIKKEMADFPIKSLIPIILSCAVGMSCTTYCSLSLEGKSIELIQSMPIKIMEIILAKMLFFVKLMAPLIVFNAITMSVCLKNRSLLVFVASCVLPICFSAVIGCGGLLLDLCFGSFEWVSAVNIVKQSIALPLTMLTTMIMNVMPIGFFILFDIPNIAVYIFTLLLWSVVLLIEIRLIKKIAKKKCIAN